MDVLFTTSTKVPTSLLMTGTKNAKKIKDKHFCSQIWQRPRLNNYKKKKKERVPRSLLMTATKKRKKEKVPTFLVVTTTNVGKRMDADFAGHNFFWGKPLNENFGSLQRIWEKKLQTLFLTQNNIYTQEEERKSLKSWSPSPLEWSSSCPHLPSIWLPSSSNNAKTFVYGLSHNDIVIFRVYPDPPLHLVIM